jgi:hypothetical protein
MGLQVFDERFIFEDVEQINDTYSTFTPVVYFAPNPGRLDAVWITSSDTVDHVMTFAKQGGNPDFAALVALTIPAGAGTDGVTPPIELISGLVGTPGGLLMQANEELTAKLDSAPSSGKILGITAQGGIF